MRLYSDGGRYWIVPEDAALPPGNLWMTDIAGNELSVDQDAAQAYEVDEATADAHIAGQVHAVVPPMVQALGRFLAEALAAPPEDQAAVIQGVLRVVEAVRTGDQAALGRFAQRCERAAADLEAHGDLERAAAVRSLPGRIGALVHDKTSR